MVPESVELPDEILWPDDYNFLQSENVYNPANYG